MDADPNTLTRYLEWVLVALEDIKETTIVRVRNIGHWRLNSGGQISLPALFLLLGKEYTAYDLMRWYIHAGKLVKGRDHSTGSEDHIAAGAERLRYFGHRGHRN